MDERTDQELVKACLEGSRSAFAQLVERHQDSVFGLAVSMTRNREDAADMAQDAFIRAYNKLEQYNADYTFRSWILRICANQTKNLFRSRMRRREVEKKALELAELEHSGSEPDYEQLEEALARLPPQLSAPLRLKHMEGLSYDEVATILGIGVSAAKMRTMRAKNKLAEILSHEG